jgi:two-component system chemotaxis response regulator CheB
VPDDIRVLVVDDSITARAVLSRLIAGEADMTVVAAAGSAEQAIELLGSASIDVILLDLEMPGMGGLKALPRLIEAGRGARILVVSSLTADGAEQTVAALALGAADTIQKPAAGRFDTSYRQLLAERVRALGGESLGAAPIVPGPAPPRRTGDKPLEALALGASTGGIHALGEFFRALPRRIGAPIFVTQHLPAAFMPVFARQLALASQREVAVAREGDAPRPDLVLIAPGDAHLTVCEYAGALRVRLERTRLDNGCLPSVDPMLASLAAAVGAGVTGVVLTGMGRDGLAGARRVAATGGTIYAQDEESSVVWGMPRGVVEAGLACGVMTPGDIARRIGANLGVSAWS